MILPLHEVIAGASQAATSALAAALWQGALLAGAAALGLRVLPETPAPVRFMIWFAVFLLVAGLPFLPMAVGHASAAQSGIVSRPWLTLDASWCVWIAAVWAAISLTRGITLLVAALRVRALWKRAWPVEAALPELARGARVCVSNEVDRPTVIGFLAPKIVMPEWLLEKLSLAELEQVVLHEAGHLSRRDDWLNLLQKIALVMFPLNPALAWVERRLCFERELACDERVLRVTGSPRAYAECLTTLAEHRLARRGLVRELALALGALGRESELGQRVLRILRGGGRMKRRQARLVFGGSMLTLVFAAGALERSPQIVAFSHSTGVQAASVRAAALPMARVAAARMVPVRASVSPVSAAGQWMSRGDAAPHVAQRQAVKAVPTVPRRLMAERRVVDRTAAADVVAPGADGFGAVAVSARADAGARPAESQMIQTVATMQQVDADGGVVVTRLMMVRAYGRTGANASRTVSDGPQAPAESNAAQQQVPRYAAVPVQGGWLVFQL